MENIFSKVSLDDGNQMPIYGFGVYKAAGKELLAALSTAFACDYRYIDTASFYHNEEEVGKALAKSGLPRNNLFALSKIWPTEFTNPLKALDNSLRKLGLEYLDAYLLHWPGLDEKLRLKTYEILLREQEKGKILTLGVSNFLRCHLEEIYKNFQIWTPINQIEIHPLYQQKELCDFCKSHNIQVISWSPLGRGGALKLPAIGDIAKKLGKSTAQVILRWHVQKKYVPIPKSVHPQRIRENADVFNFSLDEAQMAVIDSLELPNHEGRTGKDPMLWPPM